MSSVPPPGEVERLFVGVPLPPAARGHAVAAQAALPSLAGLRPVRPEQLHVTLAFLGPVQARVREVVRVVVAGVDPSLGGLTHLGGFLFLPSPRKARVVALKIHDPDQVFAGLFEHVVGGLEREGVFRREKRPFLPHLTIARLREPGLVQPKSECGQAPFPVESVCLYKSELRREGALYSILEERRLLVRDVQSVD